MRFYSLSDPRTYVHEPEVNVKEGDEWLSPKGSTPSFRRVLADGNWVDAQEGMTNERQQGTGAEAEQRVGNRRELSGGTGTDAQGDGNHGEGTSGPVDGQQQGTGSIATEGEGVDGNGSPVV